jgi:hypothetical protein
MLAPHTATHKVHVHVVYLLFVINPRTIAKTTTFEHGTRSPRNSAMTEVLILRTPPGSTWMLLPTAKYDLIFNLDKILLALVVMAHRIPA